MKILYIATSFPKPDKGSTIYTDLAEELARNGHEVTVVVQEERKNQNETSFANERNLEVLRVVIGNLYDVNYIEKGITMLKIPRLLRRAIKQYLVDRKFDFVLYESPPVTTGRLIKWIRREFGCPSYLMLKDIFPQNAVDIGIVKRNSPIYYYFKQKERELYQSASIIGCMSVANIQYLRKHNPSLNENRIELFPNTKKIGPLPVVKDYPMRQKLNIPFKTKVFLFGGNMGRPQYVELISRAMLELKDDSSIYFLCVGRGTDKYIIEDTITLNNLKNAQVIDNLPRNEYEQITKECDVGLIVLDPRFTIPNFPSRILSYLEYGMPVLAATDKVTDIKELIDQANCGEWVYSGDTFTFVNALKKMASNYDLEKIGLNGRHFLEEHYQIEESVKILEKHFS